MKMTEMSFVVVGYTGGLQPTTPCPASSPFPLNIVWPSYPLNHYTMLVVDQICKNTW